MAEGLGGDTAQVGAQPPFEENLQVGGHGSNEENMSNVRHLLVERMDPDFGLLDKLLQLCALTYPETVQIRGEKSIFDRNAKLLELIFSKMKHQALLTSLTETGQKHLFNLVTGNGDPPKQREAEEIRGDEDVGSQIKSLKVEGMSEELPTESSRDVSPTRREPRREEAYTVFSPDEKKRQTIQRQADEEARKHEEYMKANRPHYNYIGTIGGGEMSSGASSEAVTQRKLPAQGPNLTPMQKSQKYRQEEKLRKEREFEQVKQTARQKTNENEKRDKEREERLRADERRARAAFLDKVEGKSSENTPGRPADASSSASGPSAAASVKEGNEKPEFVDGLMQLENMFPSVEKVILKSLLNDADNNVDDVVQFLSQ